MKLYFSALFLVVLGGCGSEFQKGVVDDSTLPDAGVSVSTKVDAAIPDPPPKDGGGDLGALDGASGSVEASTDVRANDAGSDAPSDGADGADAAWPDDVVIEPWCPDSEMFPTYSVTCDTWGQNHGWTLQGCCLPNHTCGTAYGSPKECHR